MRSSELVKKARESKGLTQGDVAEACGISRSALGRYEVGSLRLSEEVLCKVSPLLDLNPEFFQGTCKIPFKSPHQGLIKYFVDRYTVHMDPLLSQLFTSSELLEIFSLSPPLTIIERLRHMNIADQPTYALVINDDANNTFLFRCKSRKDFISWDDKLSSWYMQFMKMTNKKGYFEKRIISKNLYEKINNWDEVTKEDFQYLFNEKNEDLQFKTIIQSQEEMRLINEYRDSKITPALALSAKELLCDLRDFGIDPEEAKVILRRHYGLE